MKRVPNLIVLAACLVSGPLYADDVIDAIDQAKNLYADGQTQQAITQLEFAAQLIRQARGTGLQAFLPEPLDGWSADAAQSQSAGAAMFGGGTTVSRSYSQAGKNVEVSIITDSPMLQSMMMMFANPAILASQGGQLQMIQGQQALLQGNGGGVMMALNNTYLVQVQGSATDADFLAYANAIDIPGLLAF